MSQQVEFGQNAVWDQSVIEKYNYSGPRYTSYPTALELHEVFTISDLDMACTQFPERPLSLYIHIPFCHTLCYYCGCNKFITRQEQKVNEYLDVLVHEIRQRAFLLQGRQVVQLHFGGGTPTYLTKEQLSRIMDTLREEFAFQADAEISIEVDPREFALDRLDHLVDEGFNRLSIGVQDFNKTVQKLVNREQDEQHIVALFNRARKLNFQSISLDLIYGLPQQSQASFAETLFKVLSLRPDRLSVFNYAHMPKAFAAQRKINQQDLPSAEEKIAILQNTIATLTQAGYQFIGMDHFALPDDELAVAQRDGKLHRNFQGYTTQGDSDLVGFGVSAISMIGNAYAQNRKNLKEYRTQVDEERHALWRGVVLDEDDLVRSYVIKQLICNFHVSKTEVNDKFKIEFDRYFKQDLALLEPFIADQLVTESNHELVVTARGRLLIRNICMCFDRYLRERQHQQQFSKVI
ncbi:oxygen-independent coproporphyrinogen III oxidase [Vibrio sp. S4M6]|uniref:oxygen-independent coproporphyrinogen III oxidase n=1 Tax=Vibrio sinus TaxID=2946865 RepID=UPI00202A0115|nr:oxygen-independent coproporphyrinogen III oxidase [Vibrio sinus]MCL9782890.1 oxygen-independent coproporphyrinogen III oxidase [Vibrio sinus]